MFDSFLPRHTSDIYQMKVILFHKTLSFQDLNGQHEFKRILVMHLPCSYLSQVIFLKAVSQSVYSKFVGSSLYKKTNWLSTSQLLVFRLHLSFKF